MTKNLNKTFLTWVHLSNDERKMYINIKNKYKKPISCILSIWDTVYFYKDKKIFIEADIVNFQRSWHIITTQGRIVPHDIVKFKINTKN